jgi:hypothetical protein
MTTLTLPGDIPGLLRVCSPVILPGGHGRGVVVAIDSASTTVQSTESAGMPMLCRADLMHLSLIDATGRAHAAWWLGAQLGVEHHGGVARYAHTEATEYGPDGQTLASETNFVWGLGCEAYDILTPDLEALIDDLDWDDARTLPDGSFWIEAEVLRRFVLHVAGRTA